MDVIADGDGDTAAPPRSLQAKTTFVLLIVS